MSKYLITGGCGFIGSHLADSLVERGIEVRILDDLSTGKKENAPREAELLIGSITNQELLQRALHDIDGVFHLAAIPSVQKSIDKWLASHRINCGATIQLYEAMTHLKRKIPLIYASSASVYGNPSDLPTHENSPTAPLSPYGIDKLAGEWHSKVLWNVFQIPHISFRFFNVYGPRQDPSSSYAGVITHFNRQIREKKPLTIYGDGEQVRDFIYVGDVARIMREAMLAGVQGTSLYNLCTGRGTSVNQLAELIGNVTGIKIKKTYAPRREGEIAVSIGDPTHLKSTLGLQSEYTLEEGLKQICVPSLHL